MAYKLNLMDNIQRESFLNNRTAEDFKSMLSQVIDKLPHPILVYDFNESWSLFSNTEWVTNVCLPKDLDKTKVNIENGDDSELLSNTLQV